MKQLTKNFHRSEFDCKDGTKVPNKYKANVIRLACNLQVLRDFVNENKREQLAININSAYRTESHNKAVKGAENSQHLTAKAVDIWIATILPVKLYFIIDTLIDQGKMDEGGLFLYNSFVHYDIRGEKRRWNYSTNYKID